MDKYNCPECEQLLEYGEVACLSSDKSEDGFVCDGCELAFTKNEIIKEW